MCDDGKEGGVEETGEGGMTDFGGGKRSREKKDELRVIFETHLLWESESIVSYIT